VPDIVSAHTELVAAKMAQFQVPPGVSGIFGSEGPEPGVRQAAFACDSPSARVLLVLVEVPASMPNAQNAIDVRLSERAAEYAIDVKAQHSLPCQVAGQQVNVAVHAGTDRRDGSPRRNCISLIPHGDTLLGVLVSTGDEPPPGANPTAPGDPQVNLTDEEVKAFFESIRWVTTPDKASK
jgi:hypothetical protein